MASTITNTQQWSTSLIDTLNSLLPSGSKPIPVTNNNIANLERIITSESAGNQAGFLRDNNPFNLNTYTAPHSSLPGGTIVPEFGINVQTFPTVQAGITATADQLLQKSSAGTIAALESNASPAVFGGSLSSGAWSGAGYANSRVFPLVAPANLTATGQNDGVAGPGFTGQLLNSANPAGGNFLGVPSAVNGVTSVASKAVSGIFAPLVKWIEEGAADVTFVGFGLVLLVIGIMVTFKGGAQINVQGSPSPSGGVGPAAGAARDAAAAAVA